jgi:hypothetical protein
MAIILVTGMWVLVLCLDTFAHLLLITVAHFRCQFLYPVTFTSLYAISILFVILRHIFVHPFLPILPKVDLNLSGIAVKQIEVSFLEIWTVLRLARQPAWEIL